MITKRSQDLLLWIPSLFLFLFGLLVLSHEVNSKGGNPLGLFSIGYERLEGFLSLADPESLSPNPKLLFPNSDFERGNLENWRASGTLLLTQPASYRSTGPEYRRVTINPQGHYWAGTREVGRRGLSPGEEITGELLSQPFTLLRSPLAFLIGGGAWAGKTEVTLEVEGRVVKRASGANSDRLTYIVWNVERWRGKSAVIRIADNARGKNTYFGHLCADFFHYPSVPLRSSPLLKSRLIVRGSGYDGQFFYFIAQDPWLKRFRDDPTRYRLFLDDPAYRYGRIGYPLLLNILSCGNPRNIPRSALFLILLSLPALALSTSLILKDSGASPLWALLLLFVPALPSSLGHLLPEPLAAALMVGGLLFHRREQPLNASLLWALSGLVRETTLLLPLAFVVEALWKKRFKGAFQTALSALPLLLWRLYLLVRLFPDQAWRSLLPKGGILDIPFKGILETLKAPAQGSSLSVTVGALLLTLLLLFASVYFLRHRDGFSGALLLYSLLALSLSSRFVWIDPSNVRRTTFELFVLLLPAALDSSKTLRLLLFPIALLTGLFLFPL